MPYYNCFYVNVTLTSERTSSHNWLKLQKPSFSQNTEKANVLPQSIEYVMPSVQSKQWTMLTTGNDSGNPHKRTSWKLVENLGRELVTN